MGKDITQETYLEKDNQENNENSVINTARPQSKHLIPWKPGELINPNGRPKGQKNYATLYREALIKIAKSQDTTPDVLELELISKGIFKARKGDYKFYKDLLDRLFGQATQNTESKNVNLNVELKSDDDPELAELRRQYNEKMKAKLIEKLNE